jgi:hypothetical protein
MSEEQEKPVEYFAEFSISVKERNNRSGYAQEVFNQRVSWSYIQNNPTIIPKVIAVINKLEIPNV